ncbi:hypothetical protein CTAYLR_003432 [Chrysophaeum taylorii]|uniref:Transaldolase n=1 Tax=Chrysophaeum taylorii TaxID=2483200 RepID=A0AAD7XIU8_9STRA|nr:hypothetical protein CTAYLR_003432 [Chrysophaeum taylorii]
MLLRFFLFAAAAAAADTVTVVVDDRPVSIQAWPGDDLRRIGESFCGDRGIDINVSLRDGRPRCATLVADELADALYCQNRNNNDTRGFRFYHGAYYFDSEEYELLRVLLLRLGLVECLSGERITGGEAVVWLLGHFDETAPFYAMLRGVSNAMPRPTELGNKDALYEHLERLRDRVGDRAVRFAPRTWLSAALEAERHRRTGPLGGIWVRKDPQIELGGGIELARHWSDLDGCEHCILQRYVDRPMLLTDHKAGIFDAKFSVGVYLAVSSMAPLAAWMHREMLVLLCSRPYDERETDKLAHLTNGLLNQRLAEDYDPAKRVWTTDRLLAHLKTLRSGVEWTDIEDQMREIAAIVLTAARAPLLEASTKAAEEAPLFAHWRLDFLLDADARVWLLEVEIVPSAGTIGGVDEVLKTTVLRDVLALAGVGAPDVSTDAYRQHYPWLRGEACWVDETADPPNRVCATPDPEETAYDDEQRADVMDILARASDPLQHDPKAIDLIAAYEAARGRAGGYRPLFPLPRSFRYFDGTEGGSMHKTGLPDLWRQEGAVAADFVLDRWDHLKARLLDDEIRENATRDWTDHLDLAAASTLCDACVDDAMVFCATVGAVDAQGRVSVFGRCQRARDECAHAPRGLVDGVALASREACDLDNEKNITALLGLLDASRAATLYEHGAGLRAWCASALGNTTTAADASASALVRACGSSGATRDASATRVAVTTIDGCLAASSSVSAAVETAIRRNTPLVIHRAACSSFSANDPWTRAKLAESSSARVVTLAFDGTRDRSQQIFSGEITLGDFLALAGGDGTSQLPRGANASLYVLLTDRHKVDGVIDTSSLANPNSAIVATQREGPVAKLHEAAVAAMDDALDLDGALEVAWTSLRLGAAYRYPTHVDCYENFIAQLDGAKNLTFFAPEAIRELRPDLATKHWPRADDFALRRAARTAETVELHPGDLAYVPLMWPHNVATSAWSATANRYFWLRDTCVVVARLSLGFVVVGSGRTWTSSFCWKRGAVVTADEVAGTQLGDLASMTTLSIDSGDLDVIAKWASTGVISDATTNPLFVAQAGTSGDARYVAFVDRAIAYARERASGDDAVILAMDRLAVELGLEIVRIVPGYVSTEVDVRASFDTAETVRRARRIIEMYEAEGVDRSRVLVKVAGTFEGIKAAEILEAEGIACNVTLVFGFVQAVLSAQAKARLISPFPGRVLDWWKLKDGFKTCEPDDDPGVLAVRRVYEYYKKHGHDRTICMPASWRPSRGNDDPRYAVDEIVALAGVDRMTIPAPLLEILAEETGPLPRKLDPETAKANCKDDVLADDETNRAMSESRFRLELNADVCATTKLAEGINAFIAETLKLEAAIRAKF